MRLRFGLKINSGCAPQPDDLFGDQNGVMPIDRSMVDEQLLRLSPDEGLDLLRMEGDRRGTLKIETRCDTSHPPVTPQRRIDA
jgi:hypothetical protein